MTTKPTVSQQVSCVPETDPFEAAELQDRLLEALSKGDAQWTTQLLRQVPDVRREFLDALAFMFDGQADDAETERGLYPYRLKFARWGEGHPSKGLEGRAEQTAMKRLLQSFFDEGMGANQAVQATATKLGVSSSKVMKLYCANKDTFKKKKDQDG